MIISEKQIMQLIMIARGYTEELIKSDILGKCTAEKITQLLYQITNQQSEELKVVE